MTRNQRARRVAKLCCHCARNAAYYRSGWRNRKILVSDDFWTGANSNFLELMVLEWCKLFTDSRGKHHWGKIVPNPGEFLPDLLDNIEVTGNTFEDHCKEMKTYRDKFVAHLDNDLRMQIPRLTISIDAVCYLYRVVLDEYFDVLGDAPRNLRTFYRERFAHAKSQYEQAT